MNWLEIKYLNLISYKLDRFKKIRDNVFVFRCPFCGDSRKKKTKLRGYIYTKKGITKYKCHNCGMNEHFSNFLKTIDGNLYREFNLEKFKEANILRVQPKQEEQTIEYSENQEKLKEVFALKYCFSLASENFPDDLRDVYDYARKRKIPSFMFDYLYACRDIKLITKNIEKYKDQSYPDGHVLVIPFFKQDGSYDFVQCRNIDKKLANQQKYITFEVNEGLKLFGMDRVQKNKPVYLFEGPIDSMFIENGIASGGISFDEIIQYLTNNGYSNIVVCYDNDYKSNKEVKKQIMDKISKGYKVVIFDNTFNWKDINDSVEKGGWTIDKINQYIKKRTFSGLYARIEITRR